MTVVFSILSTRAAPVTGVAYTYQPDAGFADPNALNDPKPWLIRVWSSVNICVRVDGQPATPSDFPVAAGLHGEVIALHPGGSISVVKQAGEADGQCFFAHVKRV
jgi:hypothetical protein